jgi:uncharacterized membrane protein YkoI
MKKLLLMIGLSLTLFTACGSQGNRGTQTAQDTIITPSPTDAVSSLAPTASAPGGSQTAGIVNSAYISEDKAKEIAFTHAAVQEANVSLLRVHFEYDDMRAIYEVDFYSGTAEYDYDIDAITGDILGFDVDQEFYQGAPAQIPTTDSNSGSTQNTVGANTGNTTVANAGNTAGTDTGNTTGADTGNTAGANVGNTTGADTGNTAGANTGNTAGANTGNTAGNNVVSAPGGNTGNYDVISAADAENVALNHAGLSSANVSFLRSHLDRDDGRTLYEVSFYYNMMEYEYDIDAITGNILSFDQDYDD